MIVPRGTKTEYRGVVQVVLDVVFVVLRVVVVVIEVVASHSCY